MEEDRFLISENRLNPMFIRRIGEDEMKLTLTPEAGQWFLKEMDLRPGDSIRFLGKVYGATEIHEGFSVGISLESPSHPLAQQFMHGVLFFTDIRDDWFFSGHDLVVELDLLKNEPVYHFIPENQKKET